MNNLQKEQMRLTDFASKYLQFKETLVKTGLFDLNEIIKLFEVWLRVCS